MGCTPQAGHYSYDRTITNPFDIGIDEILPGLPQARHLSVEEYPQGHLLQSCLPQLQLCPLLTIAFHTSIVLLLLNSDYAEYRKMARK